MDIKMRIAPRCSGKTTKLIDEFLKEDMEEVIYIAMCKSEIVKKLQERGVNEKKYFERVVSVDGFISHHSGMTLKKMYIDEWLLINDKSQLILYNIIKNVFKPTGLEEIIIATTSDKIYEKSDIETVRLAKKLYNEGNSHLYDVISKRRLVDMSLFYNFLGEDDCLIRNESLILPCNDDNLTLQYNYGNKEKFLIERCGVFYK